MSETINVATGIISAIFTVLSFFIGVRGSKSKYTAIDVYYRVNVINNGTDSSVETDNKGFKSQLATLGIIIFLIALVIASLYFNGWPSLQAYWQAVKTNGGLLGGGTNSEAAKAIINTGVLGTLIYKAFFLAFTAAIPGSWIVTIFFIYKQWQTRINILKKVLFSLPYIFEVLAISYFVSKFNWQDLLINGSTNELVNPNHLIIYFAILAVTLIMQGAYISKVIDGLFGWKVRTGYLRKRLRQSVDNWMPLIILVIIIVITSAIQ